MNGKPKLTNQDSLIIRPNFRGTKGSYLFTVQDGHGTYGFQVSQFIRSTFPVLLEKHLDFNFSSFSIERNITKVIHKLTESLQNSGIEIAFSGSTLNSVLIFGNSLICSNIGDSRAILGRFSEEGWGFLSLSSDHSLKRFDERQRILNSNGRIDYSLNSEGKPVGPERVWLADENIPGLAMTRSIGDSISKVVGVTSDPETIVRRLRPEDKFLVMASDGLWEKLSNEDVLSIVSSYFAGKNVEEATAHLVNEATRRWRLDDYRDDITVIVVFLQVF
jgi:serine/threonine protein phosphatase PrpC